MGKKSVKLTMLYDGDCGFCSRVISRWQRITAGAITYRRYQEALPALPQLSTAQCQEAVQLVLPDGSVVFGAHAVFYAFDAASRLRLLHWCYDHLPFFGRFSELLYQMVAHHRFHISKIFSRSGQRCDVRRQL